MFTQLLKNILLKSILVRVLFAYREYLVNCYMFLSCLKISQLGCFFAYREYLVGCQLVFFACREYLVDYQLNVIVWCVLGLNMFCEEKKTALFSSSIILLMLTQTSQRSTFSEIKYLFLQCQFAQRICIISSVYINAITKL